MPVTPDVDANTARSGWTLQHKAFAVTLALVGYVLVAAIYVAVERSALQDTMQALESLALHERALVQAENTIDHAMADAREAAVVDAVRSSMLTGLAAVVTTGAAHFGSLEPYDASYALLSRMIDRSWASLLADPSPSGWQAFRDVAVRVHDELEIRHSRLAEKREGLNRDYQRRYDAVTVKSLLLLMLGVTGFGSVAAWFVARLAADVRQLEQHALQIVRGVRGVKLLVRRSDELGRLMHAVNQMAEHLDEREKQIELEAQRRSHHDKMLTVGALAAGVAHEVNNPLAVISGVAQDWRSRDSTPSAGELAESAQLVLAQIERASRATRHLAEAAVPEMSELDWIDVNAIVRRAVQLMGYDKRYRRIEFVTMLDLRLPAAHTSGTAVQQVLMQMLSLGCAAMIEREALTQKVSIHTLVTADGIEAAIDFPPVLDFARREVQRTLLLARAIVEPVGGRLAFAQADDRELRMKLRLPVETGGGDS